MIRFCRKVQYSAQVATTGSCQFNGLLIPISCEKWTLRRVRHEYRSLVEGAPIYAAAGSDLWVDLEYGREVSDYYDFGDNVSSANRLGRYAHPGSFAPLVGTPTSRSKAHQCYRSM
jgi:hypothetical protein